MKMTCKTSSQKLRGMSIVAAPRDASPCTRNLWQPIHNRSTISQAGQMTASAMSLMYARSAKVTMMTTSSAGNAAMAFHSLLTPSDPSELPPRSAASAEALLKLQNTAVQGPRLSLLSLSFTSSTIGCVKGRHVSRILCALRSHTAGSSTIQNLPSLSRRA